MSQELIPLTWIDRLLDEGKNSLVMPTRVEPEGAPFMVVPGRQGEKAEVLDMEDYLLAPVRKKGAVTVIDSGSFCLYVNKHKDTGTMLKGSASRLTVVAVIDHHSEEVAGWGDHACTLKLTRSNDWDKWTGQNEKPMTQSAFADLLEDLDHTIIEPQAARIVEIATRMRLHSNKRFESSVNRTDGSFSFTYVDEASQVKGQEKLPDKFLIRVEPFKGAEAVELLARLRYRLSDDGKLSLAYSLLRPDKALEEAFDKVVKECEKGTGEQVLLEP